MLFTYITNSYQELPRGKVLFQAPLETNFSFCSVSKIRYTNVVLWSPLGCYMKKIHKVESAMGIERKGDQF